MLPIRKVILYKHGVGYFERQGEIRDDSAVKLAFRHHEMNDVLKSLTVLDLSGGIVQSISYESTRPLQHQLGDIALSIPDDHAMTGLLAQIKGARVAVENGGRQLEGVVVGIEKVPLDDEQNSDGALAASQLLTLLIDGDALHTLDLRQIKRIVLLDEPLKQDLQHLLEVLIGSKRKDLKQLTIHTQGKGRRSLFVSYVLEAPVWKTSYRILLDNDSAKTLIQGWALIDNTGDEDWDNVALTLVSGLPVSFVHDLYSPRYQKRPVIEVSRDTAYEAPLPESGRMPQPLALAADTTPDTVFAAAPAAAAPAARMARAAAQQQSVPVQTTTAEIGDSFQYQIQIPVTVRRRQSALVPILQTTFEGRRVVLFNPQIRERNPLSALLFKNTTGLMLEGGPITIFEQDTYQGEAMLETLKPNEQRLIPFSIELGCIVSLDHRNETLDVHQLIIANGVAELFSYQLQRTVYFIDNKTGRALELYLDHRFKTGWELEECESQPEITEHYYRFRLETPASQITRFTVTEKGKVRHTVQIAGIKARQLQLWFDSRYIDDTVRRALNDLITLRETLTELDQRLAELEQTVQTIFSNQERLRQNLQTLGRSDDEKALRERYVAELNKDEDKLSEISAEIERRHAEKHSLEQHLATRLKNFHYESKPAQRTHQLP